jgi:glycosyltransferase involved in cell wall biosynthesis
LKGLFGLKNQSETPTIGRCIKIMMSSEKNNPFVSIIIPTRNRSDILPYAIKSVLDQTYKNLEVIVVDDGSVDDTEVIVMNMMKNDNRIQYIRNDISKGACAARNLGIMSAKGDLISFVDDDDQISINRLEILVAHYDDQYSLICSKYSSAPLGGAVSKHRITTKKISLSNLLNKNYIGCSALVSKQKIMAVGGFDIKLRARQDYDLWVRILDEFGKALQISAKTYYCDKSSERERISNSKARRIGVIQFYKKHSRLMTCHQRKNAIVACLEANNFNPGFLKLLVLLTWRNRKKVFGLLKV